MVNREGRVCVTQIKMTSISKSLDDASRASYVSQILQRGHVIQPYMVRTPL